MEKKLLIITQKLDRTDPVLGFFHRWVEEFAKHAERVEVIALGVGEYELPQNVRVHSLGKERGAQSRAAYLWRFLSLVWRLRREYDAVFVHMNPEYVALAGLLWRLEGKKTGLWYVHRSRTVSLMIATWLSDFIFTSAAQSMRLPSRKTFVVGHGIDFSQFAFREKTADQHAPKLVSVGRITPIKDLETVIAALSLLRGRGTMATLALVGAPAKPSDVQYERKLRAQAEADGGEAYISFAGAVPYQKMSGVYEEADVSINACPTGGVDKAVLESLACGVPAFFANESFRDYFGDLAPRFRFSHGDAKDLAEKIEAYLQSADQQEVRRVLAERVREKADLGALVTAIMARYAA